MVPRPRLQQARFTMSPSFSGIGESTGVITDGHPDSAVSRTVAGTAPRVGPPRRAPGAHRGGDYRLRGLVIDQTVHVPPAPTQTDIRRRRSHRPLTVAAELVALAV